MKKYHVYGIGAALVDTEIQVSDDDLAALNIDKGLMTLVDEDRQHELIHHLEGHLVHSRRASGGSACNSIIAASYFGASAFYSCRVANDENGDFYLNDLKQAGVDSNFHGDKDNGITGKCLVMISPDAERSMNTFLGISETLSTADLNEQAIADSEFIYMEGYLVTSPTGRAAAIAARKIAEANRVKTAFTLSDPGMVEFFKDGLAEMIGERVDLLFCNKEEALGWAATDSLDRAIAEMKKIAKTFAITLGHEGALLFDGEKLIPIKGNKVDAVDTNGAGDMFAGAFIYAISHGHSYQVAGELASLASARVVAGYGPRLPVNAYAGIRQQIIG
jgi:sugar/nucleoside kinase (ribokinase family)